MQELIEKLFSCAAGQDFWRDALDLACAELFVPSATLLRFDNTAERTVSFEYSSFFLERPELVDLLEAGDDDVDPANYQLLFELPAQKFFSEQDANSLILGRDKPEYPFKDKLRASGLTDRAAATLNFSGPSIDFIAMQVANNGQMTALTQNPKGSVIAACLAGAVSTARIFSALRARYNTTLQALGQLGLGVLLVLSDGTIISSNAEGERITRLADGILKDRKGLLRITDPDNNALLGKTLATCHTSGKNQLLNVPKRSGEYDYLISIQPIEDAEGDLEKGLRCAFVLLVDPAGPTRLESEGLAALGGLSEVETEVLSHLLRGHSVAETSELRDTSVATTRTHLRSILSKLRCRTQADLIRLAAETRLPFQD